MALFKLEPLPYDYNALEPHIDAETLKVHHGKHHQTYCDKFNAALKEATIDETDILKIFSEVSSYPVAVRNHGGGYWNHTFYWESMATECAGPEVNKDIAEAIINQFGSLDAFQEEFSANAAALFGSGWTWLIVDDKGVLKITNTSNQDNPYMDVVTEKGIPLLVLDVWEHAYYLKYQNRRPEYIKNFFNVINWDVVNQRFLEATST